MADVVITATPDTVQNRYVTRRGIFWKNKLEGYHIYLNSSSHKLVYKKTGDGGATWGAEQSITTNYIDYVDCFADWEVPGDTGKLIHLAICDVTATAIKYFYIDTSTDTVSGGVTVQNYPDKFPASNRSYCMTTIAKSKGGMLGIAFRYVRSDSSISVHFYNSPDGSSWTDRDCSIDAVLTDHFILFPGNETDPDDFWMLYWDDTASSIYLHTYDDSVDSWSTQLISAGFILQPIYIQFMGVVRKSDGHLLMCAWEDKGVARDFKTWDINGAGSITAKTDILTTDTTAFLAAIQVDQTTNYVYAFCVKGNLALFSLAPYMFISTDGMANWDAGASVSNQAGDDMRCIWCGPAHPTGGGWIMSSWFNDDTDEILTYPTDGVEIDGVPAGNPPMQSLAVKTLLAGDLSGKGM